MKKLRVGILFGGRSGEHEISLLSAASVLQAIDKSKFDVVPIGITKQGGWLTGERAHQLLTGDAAASLLPAGVESSNGLALLESDARLGRKLDVIFPVLHGTFGEDGTIQGLLELADIAYVGAGVLGSAAGMDKDVMKRLFRDAKLPIVKHVTLLRAQWETSPKKCVAQIEAALKYPVFVKPANLGSSVGISKAHDRKELGPALNEAARYDRKLVIEQGVGSAKQKAREIECSVLGNDEPLASIPGEIIPCKEFYDYEAKYLAGATELEIPAKLTKVQIKQVRELAVQAFQAVDCSGLARVDFLMDAKSGKLYVNEINTMPGFTSISMYPKLWAATGVGYSDLISRLIALALDRHADKLRNQYSR